MLLPTTTVLAGVLLLLPQPSLLSCISATKGSCRRAKIASGTTLAGDGFDITTMQRKGAVINMRTFLAENGSCTLCKNPYNNSMQKIPKSVINWKPLHNCRMAIQSKSLESALSVANHVSESVENNWMIDLGLNRSNLGSVSLAGTHARLTTTAMEKSKQDRFTYVSHSVECGFYKYMISSNPKLKKDFKQALDKLPHIYSPSNKTSFDSFIGTYGTHFLKEVQAGGKVQSLTSIRECKASLMGLNADEVKMCLTVEASAKIKQKADFDLGAEKKFCSGQKKKLQGGRSFSEKFRERTTQISGGKATGSELLFSSDTSAYKRWIADLPDNPDVISYTLMPLHQLVSSPQVKKGLKQAIRDYILIKGLKRTCSDRCNIGRRTNSGSCACHCQSHKGLGTNCCPTCYGQARVILTIIKGEDLYGDTSSGGATDGYVKVFDKNNILLGKTPMITDNNSPIWNYQFNIGDMILSADSKLKIEVWDEDNRYDDLLGTCYAKLRSDNREIVVCPLSYGRIFYQVKVTCGPSLKGPSCATYKSSPMSSLLETLYVSRHARPIPRHMLFQMGMRLDRQAFNYTLTGQSSAQNGGKADRL
ncbi:perforin-1-like [Sardina pilchardus]|uniref:perforin-1-like n=1 Tax=Sardina pilchardus TaxID=27697 RepID=UPI002E12FBFA